MWSIALTSPWLFSPSHAHTHGAWRTGYMSLVCAVSVDPQVNHVLYEDLNVCGLASMQLGTPPVWKATQLAVEMVGATKPNPCTLLREWLLDTAITEQNVTPRLTLY